MESVVEMIVDIQSQHQDTPAHRGKDTHTHACIHILHNVEEISSEWQNSKCSSSVCFSCERENVPTFLELPLHWGRGFCRPRTLVCSGAAVWEEDLLIWDRRTVFQEHGETFVKAGAVRSPLHNRFVWRHLERVFENSFCIYSPSDVKVTVWNDRFSHRHVSVSHRLCVFHRFYGINGLPWAALLIFWS